MAKGFTKGDPRAVLAGRKGGSVMRPQQSAEYLRGYRSGFRQGRRGCAALRVKLAELVADLRARTWLSPLSASELNHRDEFLASTIEALLPQADAKEGR